MEEKTKNPYDGVDAFKISGKYAEEVWNEGHAVGKVEGEVKGWNEAIEKMEKAEIESFPDDEPDCKQCEATRLRYLKALRKKEMM
ncbi:MAG: hypothetical protein ACXADO_00810 [Candidatus Thorarchaeota archaeon]|jgi:hypothetical protein